MIEAIKGIIAQKLPDRVVIENSGIFYEMLIPFSTTGKLPSQGNDAKILCHLNWRHEEGPQLFGFATEEERKLFRLLTKVNKVGPKLALNIMSSTEPQTLAQMILSEDQRSLTSLKGVGPKLASRLIVELREQITKLGFTAMQTDEAPARSVSSKIPFEAEVKEALANLGYTPREVNSSLKKIAPQLTPESTIEEIIEAFLRSF